MKFMDRVLRFVFTILVFLVGAVFAEAATATPTWPRGCKGYVPPPSLNGEPEANQPPSLEAWNPGHPGKPMSYKDAATATIFYVESDGRHLAHIAKDGRLLWVRNPFEDINLCPYRNAHPTIVGVEPFDTRHKARVQIPPMFAEFLRRHRNLIWVQYDSSQWIYVDVETGESWPGGNN